MGFFLGIDGGGSKTECVLADEAGAVLARATGTGTNLRRTSPSELRAVLSDCLAELCGATSLPKLAPEVVCAGFAGAGHPEPRQRARDVLAELLHPRWLYVVGDMEVALEAAVGAGPGVVLVAGTGSIAYGRHGSGQQARAGGAGPEAGDEGSAVDIGRRAVEAVERAQNGQGPATEMTSSVTEFLRATTREPGELASLLPRVVEAARAGDEVARAILEEAAAALAGLAVAVFRELNLLETDVRVATSGGVFSASPEILASVREKIRGAAPRAVVEPLGVTPAEGAVRLAQRLWLQERAKGQS